MSLGADKQLLLALCRLPREHVGAKEEDLDRLASRQARGEGGVGFRDGDLGGGHGGRDRDGGGFLGSFHNCSFVECLQIGLYACVCMCTLERRGKVDGIRGSQESERKVIYLEREGWMKWKE